MQYHVLSPGLETRIYDNIGKAIKRATTPITSGNVYAVNGNFMLRLVFTSSGMIQNQEELATLHNLHKESVR